MSIARTVFFSINAAFVLLCPVDLFGGDYRVAHQSDGFTTFEHAVINNSGVVVFSALRRDATTGKIMRGVYKGRGGTFQVVAESPAFEARPPGGIAPLGRASIGINNAGLVSFSAVTDWIGGVPVFVSEGPVRAKDQVGIPRAGGFLPTVTDNGYVAFGTTIQPYPYVEIPQFNYCDSCRGTMRLNNRQQYVLSGGARSISVITFGTVTRDEVRYMLPIRTNVVATISEEARIGAAVHLLNDNGQVAFYDLPAAGIAGLYISPNTPFVENRQGSEFTFNGIPAFSLNNHGVVAFEAHSRTWGSKKGPNTQEASPFSCCSLHALALVQTGKEMVREDRSGNQITPRCSPLLSAFPVWRPWTRVHHREGNGHKQELSALPRRATQKWDTTTFAHKKSLCVDQITHDCFRKVNTSIIWE